MKWFQILILQTRVTHFEGSRTLTLCFFAVHPVLALQFEGCGFLTPDDRVVRQVLKRFGGRAAVWERVLLEGVLVNVGVGAGVLLDGVHPLVVLLGRGGRGGRGRQGLQRLVPAGSLSRRERLDDANGGRVQAAQHLHVLQDTRATSLGLVFAEFFKGRRHPLRSSCPPVRAA